VLPIGSCGTTAGLLLGLQMIQSSAKIIAVTTYPAEDTSSFSNQVEELFTETNIFLNSLCSRIPLFEFPHEQLIIDPDFCGAQYGLTTPVAQAAHALMRDVVGISLEATYSAKAFACLLFRIEHEESDAVVLFWDTYCGLDFSSLTQAIDYTTLPAEVHDYFKS
jgi:D-cysteine desulfhydrase